MLRAMTLEELEPFQTLCRHGRLFEVQEWVRQGKPVALPENVSSRSSVRNPLRIAMNAGFHSLVQVLLEAGAPHQEGNYNALEHAVDLRRPDLAEILLLHGAKVEEVPMRLVLDLWAPDMVQLFQENGADLDQGYPIAWALVHRIRPALGLVKRLQGVPGSTAMKQAEIALRFHAYEGNTKWVSLLLWAGADPWARGIYRTEELEEPPDAEDEEDEPYDSAVELAVLGNQIEVLKLKKLAAASAPSHSDAAGLLNNVYDSEMLSWLLQHGHHPSALKDHGTCRINCWINFMAFDLVLGMRRTGLDSQRAREYLKMIHLFVDHGARWLPEEKHQIKDVRRNLLKMKPDYTLEFIWLLQQYRAARRRDLQELLRPPSMTRLLGKERARAEQIVAETLEEPCRESQLDNSAS